MRFPNASGCASPARSTPIPNGFSPHPSATARSTIPTICCKCATKPCVSRAETARADAFSRHTLHRLERLFRDRGLAGLVPRKRDPRGPHKISDEILRFVDEQRTARGPLGSTVLVREIQARFGVAIHRVSLDQAWRDGRKRGDHIRKYPRNPDQGSLGGDGI